MKTIKNIAVLFALVPALLLSSCSKEYLDRTPTTSLDTEMVLSNPDLIPQTVVGTMRMMYSSSFGGKYATIMGDIMTDMVTSAVRGSNGSFKEMEEWNINQSTTDVLTLWGVGYQIAAAAARTIDASKKQLADSARLTTAQRNNLKSALASSLTIKAYTEYFLTQYFCVDVNISNGETYMSQETYEMPGNNKSTPVGLILLKDRALTLTEDANMSTLKATYKFMEEEIAEAIEYFQSSGSDAFTLAGSRYFPTLCAAYMVQARIFLAQHNYEAAATAAENALGKLPSGANKTLISKAENLLKAYGENLSSEDVWSLNYTNQDNLSANSLQNLFSSYGFNPSPYAISLFHQEDIRLILHYDQVTRKLPDDMKSYCMKYPNENAVFNVPIFRVPEIYLVQAEAYAGQGKLTEAKEALLAVIGARDTSVAGDMAKMEENYKVSADSIMQTILDENAREFLGEGHRWYDLRRNGVRLSRQSTTSIPQFPTQFQNYPISIFALPVPYGETSTEQWKHGRGLYDDGSKASTNWQNNAWDELAGDSYANTVELPVDDGEYSNLR
ncbi:MAG: RagB/SusD family nutrient uptake outer membrane protein [Bacteroidales bacterium]|nr:RagB/SusD family nutrient uptake outer membrane protein [Bacteroidales bacterium]